MNVSMKYAEEIKRFRYNPVLSPERKIDYPNNHDESQYKAQFSYFETSGI